MTDGRVKNANGQSRFLDDFTKEKGGVDACAMSKGEVSISESLEAEDQPW